MIGRVYRLIDTKRIEMKQREIVIARGTVLVKPEFLSICAADERYYLGQRKRSVLRQKLPMALIHEATGRILQDFRGKFLVGDRVALIPLEEGNEVEAKGNYRTDSKFASSGMDGFMQDVIAITPDRLVPIKSSFSEIYVFAEIVSVVLGALESFESARQTPADSFGVWGDGSMGYVVTLALRILYPNAKIHVLGKTSRKLQKFLFAEETSYIDDIPKGLKISHAFECVGGEKSQDAIAQIINHIKPQGVVNLFGVSENQISIDTRRVLEKGLKLIGNSRSNRGDFEQAVQLIQKSKFCQRYLRLLISETIEIKNEKDISHAFEQSILNDFKTVIKWSI